MIKDKLEEAILKHCEKCMDCDMKRDFFPKKYFVAKKAVFAKELAKVLKGEI